MLVKALKSFAGKVSMYAGEVREINNKVVLDDLLTAGYVEPEIQEAEVVERPVAPAPKPTKKKKK
jgi:hypothetical protein